MHTLRGKATVGFLILGIALIGAVTWKVGLQNMLDHMALIGWGVLPVLCVSTLWKANNTLAWLLAFPPGENLSFWRLFVVNLAGDVVNNMLPTANLGGELAKPYLLRPQIPVSKSLSAVVANKTMEIVSGLIFTALCVCLAFLYLPLEAPIRLGMVLAVLIGGSVIFPLCLVQRRGLFTWLLSGTGRVPFLGPFLRSKQEVLRQVDRSLAAFYNQNRGRFLGCLGLRLGSWVLGAFETFLILHLLGVDPTVLTALLLVALPLIIDTAVFFVPANVGTSEAGHTYVSFLLGFNPAVGLSLGLLKRFRRFFWMGVGIVLLYPQISHTLLKSREYRQEDIGELLG